MILVFLSCATEAPTPPPLPAPVPSSRPRISPGDVDFECGKGSPDDYQPLYPDNIVGVAGQYYVTELQGVVTRFDTVMFDKFSAAVWNEALKKVGVKGQVMDVGTGTGVLGLLALHHGASGVVATELDPIAQMNADHNALALGKSAVWQTRLVSFEDQGAFAVIQPEERFDLILSDPPQGYDESRSRTFPEILEPTEEAKEAFFSADVGYCFLESLISGLPNHLTPDGQALLAMKSQSSRKVVDALAKKHGLETSVVLEPADPPPWRGKRVIGDTEAEPNLAGNMAVISVHRAK